MNKSWLSISFIVILLAFSCSKKKEGRILLPSALGNDFQVSPIVCRTSVTFILGHDNEHGENPYYTLANHYYRLDSADKTEILVDTLTSLLEVRDYLEMNRPANGLPWGMINLVSHGNEFIDLSVKVLPGGLRTSAESLREAVKARKFKPLDSTLIDANTTIYLHGCAVGNNKDLLNMLAVAFGGKQNLACVKASKMFEYYAYTSNNRNPKYIRHYFAKVWYVFFNPYLPLEEDLLIKQLKKRYPSETMNWEEAINREYQTNPSQSHHITLGVPVIWDDVYETCEERPILTSLEDQEEWLKKQKGLYRLMKQSKVPQEYFDIKCLNTTLRTKTDETCYSLRAKAKAGVMCLIQPLLSDEKEAFEQFDPFVPNPMDTVFFGFANFSSTK